MSETKPWEEEWEQSDERWIERPCPVDGKPLTVARFDSADGGARARLASKAPKMARALLGESGTGHHTYHMREEKRSCAQCFHWAPNHDAKCAFAVVLREAGVLE